MNANGLSKTLVALALAAGIVAQAISPVFADSGKSSNGAGDKSSANVSDVASDDMAPIFPHVFEPYGWGQPKPATPAIPGGTAPLTFHGGVAGTGDLTSPVSVTTGKPLVYLVIWGSQWGTRGTTTVSGAVRDTFTGDTKGMIPYLESFLAGIGTNNETWSGVLSQFCEGAASGASTCPATATTTRVGYPTGGALAGVLYHTSTPAPQKATQAQLGAQAVQAAQEVGNLTQSSNRSVQYVVVSPTGTNPDGFNTPTGSFCAWHTYQPSVYGNLAFTNLPYTPDMGASCGANFVNPTTGVLDGVSIVEGHEYAETVTDQWPSGGWYDGTSGAENGDKCSWQGATGGNGGNLVLATGTFAMQGTWSNISAACSMGTALTAAAAVAAGTLTANLIPVVTGGNLPYSISITGGALPSGLVLNPDGTLSGTTATASTGNVINLDVTDASGATLSAVVNVDVIARVATTTSVTASANAVLNTTPVTLSATLTPGIAGQSLTFKDGTTVLGSAITDANGVATLAAQTFTGGSHSITATFAATGIYLASTSPAVVVSVAAAISSLALSIPATAINPTTSVTMTASLSPVIASATITFYDGATSLGTARTSASGVATLAKTFTVGTHNLTAKFAGTTAATASTSAVVTLMSTVVAPGAPTAPKLTKGGTAAAPTATATWTAPGSTGGSAITAYTVYVYQGTTLIKTVPGPTTRSVVITGLTSKAVLNIKVSATNIAGEGAQSVASAAVTMN